MGVDLAKEVAFFNYVSNWWVGTRCAGIAREPFGSEGVVANGNSLSEI